MNVITNAEEAIRIADTLKGTAQTVSAIKTRKFKHWSFYVLAVGSIAGVITVIAASILSMYALIAVGGVLALTNALGTYYIFKFEKAKELTECVDLMATKIRELSGYVNTIKKANQELKGVRTDLEANLQEETEVWEYGYTEVKKSADEIQSLTERLDVTTKKLKVLQTMYTDLQNAVNQFSNYVSGMNDNQKNMDEKVSILAGQVTDAKEVIRILDSENNEFDEHNELYKNLNKANVDFLMKFQEELDKILHLGHGAKEFKEVLEKKSSSLAETNAKIESSLSRLEKLNEKASSEKDDSKKLVAEVDKLTAELNSLADILAKAKPKPCKGT